jgi:hypothetical protein
VAVFLGARIGAVVANRLSGPTLRLAFGAVLVKEGTIDAMGEQDSPLSLHG